MYCCKGSAKAQGHARLATHAAPIHERAATMWGRNGRERQGSVILRLEVRDEVSAVQSAHGMREEVHASRRSLVTQEPVKVLCTRRHRAGAALGLRQIASSQQKDTHLGTPVTNTSAPTFFRNTFRTLDQ